jgi:hypothetical protein
MFKGQLSSRDLLDIPNQNTQTSLLSPSMTDCSTSIPPPIVLPLSLPAVAKRACGNCTVSAELPRIQTHTDVGGSTYTIRAGNGISGRSGVGAGGLRRGSLSSTLHHRQNEHNVAPGSCRSLELLPPPTGSNCSVSIFRRLLRPARATARTSTGKAECRERFKLVSADMGDW